MRKRVLQLCLVAGALISTVAHPHSASKPFLLPVRIDPELGTNAVSGRLLVFFSSQSERQEELLPQWGADAHSVWLAAEEIDNLRPGDAYYFNADHLAYPRPFSEMPVGDYQIMAVLDVGHHYAYNGMQKGDLRSPVMGLGSFDPRQPKAISITLSQRVAGAKPQLPVNGQLFDFVSPSLSAFWGRPIHMTGIALLPPGYKRSKKSYSTVYWIHGYQIDLNKMLSPAEPGAYPPSVEDNLEKSWARPLREGKLAEMIYVMLDQSCPGGTHEFADSVNNGPWGHALTTELIPYLESHFRMIPRASARLLMGHSSGGWAALWLQVRYPRTFGGSWPTAPDPVDFHNFTGPDLYADHPNYYRKPDGSPWMLVRVENKDVQTLEDAARQERVLGEFGGQLASFEWVFSPRATDGRPQPLFNRDTGKIDPFVAKYWTDHWDIAAYVRHHAARLRPQLDGKIHLIVGTADTFHLDEPVRLLEQAFKDANIRADVRYLVGRNHLDLYEGNLIETVALEMQSAVNSNSGLKSSER